MSDEIKKLTNEDLGYDAFFQSEYNALNLKGFSVARVIIEHKGAYKVKNEDGEYVAKVTGKQMFGASKREDYPAVGDFVVISPLNKEQAVVETILPRRTILKRKNIHRSEVQIIATNIDVVLVVQSVDRDFNLNRFERYFVMAKTGGITPAIILNKIDLITKEELASKISEIKERFGDIDYILTSTITDEGLKELREYITKGKTYCFVGSSGVGKSSLINKLLESELIKTESISDWASRGKHSTTKREMYFLKNGGIVIDNPGMREVGVTEATAGVVDTFEEIIESAPKCKFSDCTHTHEAGCEILAMLKSGELDEEKYTNYIHLKKETEFDGMSKLEKREKQRQFRKLVKRQKKS